MAVGVGDGTDVGVEDGDGDGVTVGVGDGDGVILGLGVGVTPEVGVLCGENVGVAPTIDVGVAPVLVGTLCVGVGSPGWPGPDDEWKYWSPNTDSRVMENMTANIAAMSSSTCLPLCSRDLDRTTSAGLAWVRPSATSAPLSVSG